MSSAFLGEVKKLKALSDLFVMNYLFRSCLATAINTSLCPCKA